MGLTGGRGSATGGYGKAGLRCSSLIFLPGIYHVGLAFWRVSVTADGCLLYCHCSLQRRNLALWEASYDVMPSSQAIEINTYFKRYASLNSVNVTRCFDLTRECFTSHVRGMWVSDKITGSARCSLLFRVLVTGQILRERRPAASCADPKELRSCLARFRRSQRYYYEHLKRGNERLPTLSPPSLGSSQEE